VAACCARAESDPQAQLNLQALQKGLRERGLNDGYNLQLDVHFGANNAETYRRTFARQEKTGHGRHP
jgi:hypothetical protein